MKLAPFLLSCVIVLSSSFFSIINAAARFAIHGRTTVARASAPGAPPPAAAAAVATARHSASAATMSSAGRGGTRAPQPTDSPFNYVHLNYVHRFFGSSTHPATTVPAGAPTAGGAGAAPIAPPTEAVPLPDVAARPVAMSDERSQDIATAQHIIDHTDTLEIVVAYLTELIMDDSGDRAIIEGMRTAFTWGKDAGMFVRKKFETSIIQASPSSDEAHQFAVYELLCKELWTQLECWRTMLNSDTSRTATTTPPQQIKYAILSAFFHSFAQCIKFCKLLDESDRDGTPTLHVTSTPVRPPAAAGLFAEPTPHASATSILDGWGCPSVRREMLVRLAMLEEASAHAAHREDPAPILPALIIPVLQSNAPEIPAEDLDPRPIVSVRTEAPLASPAILPGALAPTMVVGHPYDTMVTVMENIALKTANDILESAADSLAIATTKLKELIEAYDGTTIHEGSVLMWGDSMTHTLLDPAINKVFAAGIRQAVYNLLCGELLARITPWGVGRAFGEVQRTKYALVVEFLGKRTVDPLAPIREQVAARRLERSRLATAAAS